MNLPGLADVALRLPDPVVVVDGSARVRWVNEAAERLFGMSGADAIGADAMSFVHPDDREVAAVSLASVRAKTVGTPIELRVRAVEGWRLVEIVAANLLEHAVIGGLVLSVRDLTERRRWEVAADDVGKFRSLVHNAACIIMLIDQNGRIESVSAAVTRMLGHDQELVEGRPLVHLVAPEDRSDVQAAVARALDAPEWRAAPTVVEAQLLRRDPTEKVPFELSFVNLIDDPTVGGLVVSAHDITQLRTTREALQELSSNDPLTGLPNRAALRAHLESRLEQPTTAVVMLDLDGFDAITDRFGQSTGDEILRRLAARLEASVRRGDVVARGAGDEFVVVADIDGPGQLEVLAGRLADAVEQPIELPEGVFRLNASVGLAHPEPGDTASTLLARVDGAVHIAKKHAEGGTGRADR
jgi:diguanylate cyclase (GGDEF)-like protein/PAS domain S-box-containing protein